MIAGATVWILMITLPTGHAFPHEKYYLSSQACYAAMHTMRQEDIKRWDRGSHTNQIGYQCLSVQREEAGS